jgi:hypothetical protein
VDARPRAPPRVPVHRQLQRLLAVATRLQWSRDFSQLSACGSSARWHQAAPTKNHLTQIPGISPSSHRCSCQCHLETTGANDFFRSPLTDIGLDLSSLRPAVWRHKVTLNEHEHQLPSRRDGSDSVRGWTSRTFRGRIPSMRFVLPSTRLHQSEDSTDSLLPLLSGSVERWVELRAPSLRRLRQLQPIVGRHSGCCTVSRAAAGSLPPAALLILKPCFWQLLKSMSRCSNSRRAWHPRRRIGPPAERPAMVVSPRTSMQASSAQSSAVGRVVCALAIMLRFQASSFRIDRPSIMQVFRRSRAIGRSIHTAGPWRQCG